MRLCKGFWLVVMMSFFVASTAWAQGGGEPAAPSKADEKAEKADSPEGDESGDKTGAAGATGEGKGQPKEGASAEAAKAGGATPETMDGATYVVRLRDLEQRIDELKEQIRRSHTRLSLLSDTILSGGVGGARAEIRFTNEMSNAFRLTRALFVLDGAVQYNKQDDTGALSSRTEIPIFSGSVPPGDHTLQVLIQLRGHGYGVFSYLRGYRFEVKSSHSFTVTEGKTIELEAVAWEKGGVTTPLEQRPAVRYVEKIRSGGTSAAPSKSSKRSGASGSFSIGTGKK